MLKFLGGETKMHIKGEKETSLLKKKKKKIHAGWIWLCFLNAEVMHGSISLRSLDRLVSEAVNIKLHLRVQDSLHKFPLYLNSILVLFLLMKMQTLRIHVRIWFSLSFKTNKGSEG